MASSSSKRRSYDVFLNFRGKDVRKNFLGHLYTALDQSGLYTYMDNEELRKGEQISSALTKAIVESRIAIIVFSKNYASSKWCLDELVEIMESKDQRDLIVIPVFYRVEPNEVRTPRDDQRYAQAMAKHEVKFQKEPEKVKRWKKALFDAGNLSGEHVTKKECEAGVIRRITQEISTHLNRTPLKLPKYLVGIDSRVQELKARLNLQSKDGVLMVGLWGKGGVGKTTLAKAIYNTVFREFQGSSFLERVKENFKNLVPLQKQLLSDVLPKEISTSFGESRGSQLIQERITNKRVLIILDDVDNKCQLDVLVGDCKWLHEGSRIIITTRNKHLLNLQGASYIYEVKALKVTEASKLLRMHAFPRNQQIKIRSDLVNSVLHYAKGIPLALEVVGSSLCDAGEDEWESTLKKLAQSPTKEINNVLKVGFDKLDKNEEEIFLDIACFFNGWRTSDIRKILDGCGFAADVGIRILIEHALISEGKEYLQMHDLIQLMGMDIVKERSNDDLGKQSRLWLYDDALNVLSGDAGTCAVKAIVLKLPKPEELHINPHAFKNMRKLRLLILHNVRNSSQDPIHLPNELRWLEWPHCASTPRFSHGPKKLVAADLQNSKIEGVLEQFKDFKKLKFINFSGCQCMVHMPNLSLTTDLEELNLSGCKNLESLHESVTRLGKLRSLNLSGCSRLLSLTDVLQSEDLEILSFANCSKVQRFPISPNNTKGLRELDLKGTSIGELPASIGNLVYLKKMNLTNCKELSILPSSIYRLQNLEQLELAECSKLIKFPKKEEIESDPYMKTGFPNLSILYLQNCNLSEVEFLENPSCFPSLTRLNLERNNFTNLPACRHLYNLEWLNVGLCNQLQEICEIPRQLNFLGAYHCKSLSKISSDICDVNIINFRSCDKLVSNVPTIYDLFKFERACLEDRFARVALPGREMPEWLIPNDDGYISFMASNDLIKKFLGLVVCVVVRVKEGERLAILETIKNIPSPIVSRESFDHDLNHVWFACYTSEYYSASRIFSRYKKLSGPNDWRCYNFITRVSAAGIVKKCGFRLICKPLENDREVFLRHNESLNPRLLYEVGHEASQLSTVKEIPSATEDLQNSGISTEEDSSSMAGISIEEHRYSLIHPNYRNVRPGGDMPEEFVLVEDGTISFMASQNFYDKILGLTLCATFGVEDAEEEVLFKIEPRIDKYKRNVLSGTLGSFGSDHVWIQYLKSNILWGLLEGGVDFGQFDKRYLRYSLRLELRGGTIKRMGYVIRCRQLEDDLKVEVQDNQLVDLAALCEDSHEPEDSGMWSQRWHPFRREYLRKCHMHRETGSQ